MNHNFLKCNIYCSFLKSNSNIYTSISTNISHITNILIEVVMQIGPEGGFINTY